MTVIKEAYDVICMEGGRESNTPWTTPLITISTELVSIQVTSLKVPVSHNYPVLTRLEGYSQ